MNWLSLKAKLYALGGVLLTVTAFFLRLKHVKHQRDKYKEHADIYKNQVEQKKKVDKVDAEIESEYSDKRREAKASDEMPDNIRNPNSW